MSVIILTTGAPGTGKTYSRVRWLVRNFLVENKTGLYITNFRLNVDEIASDVAKRTGRDADDIRARIVLIPDSELLEWRDFATSESKQKLAQRIDRVGFPPAMYFEQFNLENAHIALDEFHRYFCKQNSALWGKSWNEWFAEIRKLGCTFEAITQDMSLIPNEFIGKTGYRIDLIPFADERDPFFKIPHYDWYQLRAVYTGEVAQKICQIEYKKGTSFTGRVKWKRCHHENFEITPDYYKYYNSYQASEQDQKIAHVPQPYEIYKKRIFLWFLRRHFFKLSGRFLIVFLFLWLCFGGGIVMIIGGFTATLAKMGQANRLPTATKQVRQVKQVSPPVKSSDSKGEGANVSPADADLLRRMENANSLYGVQEDELLYKPALFFENDCWLRNGVKIHRGYKFQGGVYDGKTVAVVDTVERYYILDDNTRVAMY